MYYICIDPGLKGAISVTDDKRNFLYISKLPYTQISMSTKSNKKNKKISVLDIRVFCTLLKNIKSKVGDDYCVVVERLFPTGRLSPYAVFNMGLNYGNLLTCLELSFRNYHFVHAISWQKHIFKTYKHLIVNSSDTKKISISISSSLFGEDKLIPNNSRTPSDGFSDSLLISEYVRLKGIENL